MKLPAILTKCPHCNNVVTTSLDNISVDIEEYWTGYVKTIVTVNVTCNCCNASYEVTLKG